MKLSAEGDLVTRGEGPRGMREGGGRTRGAERTPPLPPPPPTPPPPPRVVVTKDDDEEEAEGVGEG